MADLPVQKKLLNDVMVQEVSRAEFLRYSGIALLSLVGVVGFLKNIREIIPSDKPVKQVSKADGGYGSSAYGG